MIHIIADTTSSLPIQKAQDLGISYMPQIVVFGDTTYRDDTEIDSATFLKKLKSSSTLPKTAAPPPALYTPVYQKMAVPGNTVFVITPSAEVSGTFRSASVAAQDFPDADIRIIDTRTIASGFGSIVLQCIEWVKQDLSPDEIETKIKNLIQRSRTYFIVDTLEYLHKGGRIGAAQMLVGSLLQVKPILMIKDGSTHPVESQRTQKKAFTRLKEIVAAECPHGPQSLLTMGQGDAIATAEQLASELKAEFGLTELPIFEMPPAILVHAGPGVISVSFFTA